MVARWLTLVLILVACDVVSADDRPWPALPDADGAVEIPAQEWPLRPGPRTVRVLVHYPRGKLAAVTAQTGVMLTLHNWGGVDCVGTADPRTLAERYDVIALCVNYLQSGAKDSIEGPEPYDFGYLQALDALRALYFATSGLRQREVPFDGGRLYCTGGSGGGNVSLMANKLAPHTFAAVVDLCGMKRLSDDIAFNLSGGSSLNARYVRDTGHPYHLTRDEQELRYVAHPEHLRAMWTGGATAKVVIVHGEQDTTCPFEDAVELVEVMRRSRLDVEPVYVRPNELDGKAFTSVGHSLGNRTEIVDRVAGKYLRPDSAERRIRMGADDFERRGEVRYRTHGGEWVISYAAGYPVGRFEPMPAPTNHSSHQQLDFYVDAAGKRQVIRTVGDWQRRRAETLLNLQAVMGPFPRLANRTPLDLKVIEEVRQGELIRRKISFQSDESDRVSAYLLIPAAAVAPGAKPFPAVLCLHQTTPSGKNEPVGIDGDPNLRYALELAERGFVTLSPDYPSFGEHPYDFEANRGYASGSMKAIWDNVRALDALESLPFVQPGRFGCIGHSLGGHNALFTAVFDERIAVVATSCGFSSMSKDDLPSWTGPRYMPRIASEYQNDVSRLPFDFHEIIAAIAPRSVFVSAATRDDDFDVSGVRDVLTAARPIFELFHAGQRLQAIYPEAPHSFPWEARREAYAFLERRLLKPVRVALIGDSTVASYPNPPADRPDLTGWGQVLDQVLDRAVVLNHAKSGRSSKSFLREGLWPPVLADRPDYVLIQFGHNDGPGKGDRSTYPDGEFQDNLRKYIDEARGAGATPILVTPVARRTFAQGRPSDSLRPYADAMRAVGLQRGVAVVDLHRASLELYARLGDEGSADLTVAPNDRTHFSRKGALAMARLVAERIDW